MVVSGAAGGFVGRTALVRESCSVKVPPVREQYQFTGIFISFLD